VQTLVRLLPSYIAALTNPTPPPHSTSCHLEADTLPGNTDSHIPTATNHRPTQRAARATTALTIRNSLNCESPSLLRALPTSLTRLRRP